ncbi:nuclear transport factor 2 family protein [Actinoallomurus sp. CA-142502]|uniref:nuclear transport factor 2 family protein n=1 Tax=Actinoallomurus sp. CA-142502 TaxID=3239885 RepID=UPI003D8B598D
MSSSTTLTPREVLARMHELTVTDEAAAVDLYAENAVHEIPFAPAGAPARIEGREALRQMMDAQGGQSPVKYQGFENVQVWETTDPEVIIAEYEVVGIVISTGAGFRIPQLLILRVRDGKILLSRSYLNPGQFAELLA